MALVEGADVWDKSGTLAKQESSSWWDNLVEGAKSIASAAWEKTIVSAEEAYAKAESIARGGEAEFKAKLNEAVRVMQDIEIDRATINNAIDAMPNGPEKERLKSIRDEKFHFYSEYVLPAWQKFAPLVGLSSDPTQAQSFSGMGLLPLAAAIPVATKISILVAVFGFLYIAYQFLDELQAFREDPAFAKNVIAVTSSFKWVGIGVVAIAAMYAIGKFKK